MLPVALFGITNSGLNLFVNLVILFLVVVWIALVAWTYLDARRRIADSVLVACATGASLFPYVGTVVYTILRPPEFIEDTRERELEIRAAELRLRQLEEQSCPNCEHPIERTFLRCPNCRARVKDPCESCGKPIDPRWSVCPYCEAPVRPAAPPTERRSSSGRTARTARPTGKSSAAAAGARPSPDRPSRSPSDGAGASERPASRSQRPARRTPSSQSQSRSAPPSREQGIRSPRRERPDEQSSRS